MAYQYDPLFWFALSQARHAELLRRSAQERLLKAHPHPACEATLLERMWKKLRNRPAASPQQVKPLRQ